MKYLQGNLKKKKKKIYQGNQVLVPQSLVEANKFSLVIIFPLFDIISWIVVWVSLVGLFLYKIILNKNENGQQHHISLRMGLLFSINLGSSNLYVLSASFLNYLPVYMQPLADISTDIHQGRVHWRVGYYSQLTPGYFLFQIIQNIFYFQFFAMCISLHCSNNVACPVQSGELKEKLKDVTASQEKSE